MVVANHFSAAPFTCRHDSRGANGVLKSFEPLCAVRRPFARADHTRK